MLARRPAWSNIWDITLFLEVEFGVFVCVCVCIPVHRPEDLPHFVGIHPGCTSSKTYGLYNESDLPCPGAATKALLEVAMRSELFKRASRFSFL